MSKLAAGDFFPDPVGHNPLGLKPRQLGKDARRGSRGECYCAADDATIDQGIQMEDLLVWFLGHGGQLFAGVAYQLFGFLRRALWITRPAS